MKRPFQNLAPLCAAVALSMFAVTAAEAGVIYHVTVDTSSVSGTTGFLDFQFNPGNATSQPATAVISGFTGGTFGAPSTTGDVSGTLPATTTFVNDTALNEEFIGYTYSSNFSFVLTLGGAAITSPNGTATAGTTFGLGLYDNSQNPILTNQTTTTGFAGQVDINLNGTTTATSFPSSSGGAPTVVTFTAAPEPATMLAIALGLIGLAGTAAVRRRRRG